MDITKCPLHLTPRLEHRIRRDGRQPILPRESTLTPVEHPFTATQAWNQRAPLQEHILSEAANLEPENPNPSAEIGVESQGSPPTPTQVPLPTIPDFNLQSLLLALSQQ